MTTMSTFNGAATPVLLTVLAVVAVFAVVTAAAVMTVTRTLNALDELLDAADNDLEQAHTELADVLVVEQAETIVKDVYLNHLRQTVKAKKTMLAHNIDDRHVTAGELAELAGIDTDAAADALADFAQIRRDVERDSGW